jgi:hypothetical protein
MANRKENNNKGRLRHFGDVSANWSKIILELEEMRFQEMDCLHLAQRSVQ